MDITVQSGQTKAGNDIVLAAIAMESAHGEHVCLLLQMEADSASAKALEKEMTGVVKHSLLETEGDASARLDGTLKELNGLLKGLLISGSIRDVHAIISIVDNRGNLHVSHAGRAEAYVVRGASASQITEYSRGKSTPAFVYIASGSLEPRDIVVFSTQRLLRAVTPAQLTQIAQRSGNVVEEIVHTLNSEKEQAAVAVLSVSGGKHQMELEDALAPAKARKITPASRERRSRRLPSAGWLREVLPQLQHRITGIITALDLPAFALSMKKWIAGFRRDLKDPVRKSRAHLLLLAGTITAFIVIWALLQLTVNSEKSKSREELGVLVEQIGTEIRTAENRRIAGDVDAANAILVRAEERAKQVMDNELGLYRMEALDLLDRIRSKREEINNIVRLAPRIVANLAAKNPDIIAQGFIGLADGEFVAYDRQDLYRILLNSVENPIHLTNEELIVSGISFPRYQTLVFQTTGNTVVEQIAGQPTVMKTEDPAGWITGQSMEAYLRFLYVLSPENNQIYKYERLSNRYGSPSQYNVNGEIGNAIDMAIDGNVFVLKDDGTVVKLLRGETKPFVIRHAPENLLQNAVRIYKVPDGSIYFLDPVGARVIAVTDGGPTGESSYVKQYVLEGDQIGKLIDLYVDPDETRVYVVDEKRIYAVDLGTK
ncbi:MAG: Uncharacterized protein Greene041662_260 [Candidatus Peregrinibacteria bacterium Greene0416_62]|nr:MAG: Uncharacterized protein Greene041662_260 [Candidatus Peregrinibacteria bacterium Greene0416_62]TSC99814.1 MAG: Uncharacterized protein Greene101449_505 [Candidatus Peregrinibacteria bacterium Greene1014_49]